VREQVETLEHHAHRLAQPGQVAADDPGAGEHRLAGYLDAAPVRSLQQVDAAHQCGLAAAALPDDAEDLAGPHPYVDVVEDHPAVEGLDQALDVDHRGGGR
jgi:hypothetical protein